MIKIMSFLINLYMTLYMLIFTGSSNIIYPYYVFCIQCIVAVYFVKLVAFPLYSVTNLGCKLRHHSAVKILVAFNCQGFH